MMAIPRVSVLALDRNNVSKKGKLPAIDILIEDVNTDLVPVQERFELMCQLPQGHSAWLDSSRSEVVILGPDNRCVGGLIYEYADSTSEFLSICQVKLLKPAQGQGLVQAFLEFVIRTHGGVYSSSSVSPGLVKIFKALADKHTAYIVWPAAGARAYAPISSWDSAGVYSTFPKILAPDGNEYFVDKLEDGFKGVKTRSQNMHWISGEIFISKSGRPPVGMRPL